MRLINRALDRLVGGPAAWRDLDHATRRDVLHHARQGRPYPDPEVADVAVQWARWMRSVPVWRRLLRAVGLAVVFQLACGVALGVVALCTAVLLPGGGFEVEHGYWWILRSLWELGCLVVVLGMWPWWDAGKVLRLNDPPVEPGEAPTSMWQ